MRTITSPLNGAQIPVTKDLKIEPLMLMGKPVTNGRGEPVMNDRWIYVQVPGYGLRAINVWRAHFCEKMYLSEVTIQEAIGANKLMDSDLKKFVDQVSDKVVFKKFGRWYRLFLRKITNRTFGIDKIVPYNWTIEPNMMIGGLKAHECAINWRSNFYIH